MTMRIGTGANAQITTYAVTLSTSPKVLESGSPVGATVAAGTIQGPSATSALTLSTGPVNPGRFYVQGATLINTDASIIIYVSQSASGNATTSTPIQPGAALRLDLNSLNNVYVFSASGTPVLKVIGL